MTLSKGEEGEIESFFSVSITLNIPDRKIYIGLR